MRARWVDFLVGVLAGVVILTSVRYQALADLEARTKLRLITAGPRVLEHHADGYISLADSGWRPVCQ